MSAVIVLCGAELNSEIEHQTARDTTVGRPKPLGARGAVMADTRGTGGSVADRKNTSSSESTLMLSSRAPGGAQDTTDACGFRVLPGGGSLDLRALRAT